jgi:WD40 repeat protein
MPEESFHRQQHQPGKQRVFISYCRSDGATFAAKLRKRLESEHPEVSLWQDVISERGGRDWWLEITEALDQVKYMVLVLTPDATKSATVRKEWRYARQKGVYVVPVQGCLALDSKSLPRWMGSLHIVDLGYDVRRQKFTPAGQWKQFINQLNSPPQAVRVPFMVEDLPEDFVDRPMEFEKLVGLLRDEKREEPVAITAALRGAGGFGKTTLARALCHDERIQEAYDDGILWLTLTENPGDLTGRIVELIEVLSGERPGFEEVEAASARLSELLAERDILMVIDDVWSAAHLRPFLNGGKRCTRLITTRNLETLPGAAQTVNVDAMEENQAVSLLAAGLSPGKADQDRLRSLAGRLGEWPLLLRLVNRVLQRRVLRQSQPLPAALEYVERALDHRGLTAFDPRGAQKRDEAVGKTLEISFEALSEEEHKRYLELAVFPQDADVPLNTVAQLWRITGNLGELETEEICSRLHALSLLLDFDLTTRRIRLHDVMRKFLAGQLKSLASVHAKLIAAWGDLRRLPDAYAWRFLAYHLAGCGRLDELRALLLSFSWLQEKLEATDVDALIADYDHFRDGDAECLAIQKSLQLSAHVLARKDGKRELASQLIGRLAGADGLRNLVRESKNNADKSSAWLEPLQGTLIPPGGPLLHTLEGHSDGVRAVAITGDGVHVISASDDRTLKVWELHSGKLLHTLEGHSNWVSAVAITGDGAQAVSASYDGTLKVWELHSGKLLHTLEGHSRVVTVVAITGDGAQAVSASDDGTLKVWELNGGKLLHTLEGHSNAVTAVAITGDGARVVSASDDGTLKVWELSSGKLLHTLEGHSDGLTAVAITGNGAHVVSASYDGTLKVWELHSGKLLHTLEGHSSAVTAVAITGDGAQAVSASDDGTLKVWELHSGKLLHTLEGHNSGVNAVAITGDGAHVVSASYDRMLKVWELHGGKLLHTLEGHSDGVRAVAITGDGAQAVSASDDGTLKVWELNSGKLLHTLEGHSSAVAVVAITRDGAQAVSASHDGTLKVWELNSGKLVHTLGGHSDWVTAAAITRNGARAISASYDRTLKVWELHSGRLLHTLKGHSSAVTAVAIIGDGAQAVSASYDGTLKVWELHSSRLLHTLEGHSNWVRAVAITGDGAQAVSASYDRTLRVWELHTGKLLHTLEGHSRVVTAVAITGNGAQAVSASYDGTLKIWELNSGKLRHTLEGHSDGVTAVAITGDGAHVVSASDDGTLKVWELNSGKLRHTLEGHSSAVAAVAITGDGAQAVSASYDRTLKVWDLRTGKLVATFSADASLPACEASPQGNIIVAGDTLGRVHFLSLRQPLRAFAVAAHLAP